MSAEKLINRLIIHVIYQDKTLHSLSRFSVWETTTGVISIKKQYLFISIKFFQYVGYGLQKLMELTAGGNKKLGHETVIGPFFWKTWRIFKSLFALLTSVKVKWELEKKMKNATCLDAILVRWHSNTVRGTEGNTRRTDCPFIYVRICPLSS